jgi:hypothetical protein
VSVSGRLLLRPGQGSQNVPAQVGVSPPAVAHDAHVADVVHVADASDALSRATRLVLLEKAADSTAKNDDLAVDRLHRNAVV